jgi:hypothetical protein
MKARSLFAAAALIALMAPAQAGAPPKSVDSVRLARTWEAAVEEAKALNVPLVVHSHGFFCGPCWGMHSAVMCNKKYIEFADDNTVEVISLDRLEEGIEKKDRKAETYDAKDENGNPVKYLKEFAGMTVEHVEALNASKAGQYNTTGKIPYVAIVDPHTLLEIQKMPGGAAAGGLMDAVVEAKAKLNKEHGPSMKRSTLQKFQAGVKSVEEALTKGGSAKALADYRKLEASVAKEPEALQAKAKALKEKLVEAAKADLDKAEASIAAGDVKAATAILNPLKSGLKGTDLEARLKELLEKTKSAPEAPK